MSFPRNIFIASGTIAVAYILLKLFFNKSGKPPSVKVLHDVIEDQISGTKVESSESLTNSNKRKIEDIQKPMKLLKPKPNFFVAFQVYDVGIHQKIKKLQEEIISKEPSLFPALVNIQTLHVTLAVTHLADQTEIKTVKSKLDEWAKKSLDIYFKEPCIVNFSGVKTFNNVVAYVDLERCKNYRKVTEISGDLNDLLSSAGFCTDNKSCTPHLTFLKLSKDFKLFRSKKKFKELFESLKNNKENFGKQEVTQLQLLSMDFPKDELGYYKCFHQINISDAQINMDHSKCCCSPIPKPKLSK